MTEICQLEKLFHYLNRNQEEAMRRMMNTFIIHRIDAKYQKEREPVIMLREYDDVGLISSARKNEKSQVKIPKADFSYTWEKLQKVIQRLDEEDFADGVEAMLLINTVEQAVNEQAPREYFDAGPFLMRKVDRYGISQSYRLSDNGHPYFQQLKSFAEKIKVRK